ncbi:MAG: VCBS repeat-containing protein [Pseudomonadota bacterium]
MRLAAAVAVILFAAPAFGEVVTAARFAAPTERYPHAVLGDAIEYGELEIDTDRGRTVRIVLPDSSVFEDTEPRLADVDGDGAPEVVVVESDANRGARLSIYGPDGLIAATPPIGTRFRWLAPVGIADLDGDGAIEIAYVDRPHLAKTLRVWRFADGALTQVGASEGFTNHKIGEPDIGGGLRECGDGIEMIVASRNWRTVMAVRFTAGALISRPIGPYEGRVSFERALNCAF